MKRFSKLVILLVAFIVFAAPVGINLQNNLQDISNQPEHFSQKTAVLSLEINVADAAFVKTSCEGGIIIPNGCDVATALLNIFELIWFQTTQIIAAVMAIVVDFLLIHSISSSTYTSGLIEAGWEIIRDFVNIVFIFALLIIAFNIVLDRQSSNSKGMLVKTLLVALVLNFSLFITYAVIDASNIFAHLFYDRIETSGNVYVEGSKGENNAGQSLAQFFNGYTGVKSPSTAVLSAFNPQRILNGYANEDGTSNAGAFESFIIIFFAGLLNILIAYVFISVALLFLGRTVGLMLLGIFAPLAFGTLTLPNAQNIEWVGFNKWWSQLLSLAFMAPIYLLLLYLTVTFATNEGVLASIANVGGGTSVISSILSVVLPFALIAMLLMMALKVTKTLAGKLGGMIVDYAKKGIGGAIAAGAIVATGGVAAAGVGMRAGAGVARIGGKLGIKGADNVANKMAFYGNKAMSFKSDISRFPGFSKLVGKDMSKGIGKVTGKSFRGHLDNMYEKSKNPAFGNEFEALEKKKDEANLKDADDAAKAARRSAEAPFEAKHYQAMMKAIKAQTPEYKEAIKEVTKAVNSLKEVEKTGDKKLIDIEKAKVRSAKESLRNTQGYDEVKQAEREADRINIEKKTEGDLAERGSREKSAQRYGIENPEMANKILKKEKPKGDQVNLKELKDLLDKKESGDSDSSEK